METTNEADLLQCQNCRYGCRASDTEYICNRPRIKPEDVAEAVLDAFLGETGRCFVPIIPHEGEK